MTGHIPLDVQGRIVTDLEDSPGALLAVSSASRYLNGRARPLLFRDLRLTSQPQLLQLAAIISSSPFVTIPTTVTTLYVDLPSHKPSRGGPDPAAVREALATVLDHFETVHRSTHLDLPWMVSRLLDWGYLGRISANIGRLVVRGTYSWPHELVRALSQMPALRSLVVDASWNSDENHWTFLPAHLHPTAPWNDVGCSAASSKFWTWMVSVEPPLEGVRHVRVKIDGFRSREAAASFVRFFQRYGREVQVLYLWFEEVYWLTYSTVYQGGPHSCR